MLHRDKVHVIAMNGLPHLLPDSLFPTAAFSRNSISLLPPVTVSVVLN